MGVPALVRVDGGHPEGFAVRGEVWRMAAHMVRCSSIVASRGRETMSLSETDAVGVGVSLAALVDGFAGGGFQVIG